MNRLRLSLASALLLALLAFVGGCGSSESKPDPQSVLNTALTPQSLNSPPGTQATVQVQSLGADDNVLDSRTVPVEYNVLTQLEQTLAQSKSDSDANPGKPGKGSSVVTNLVTRDPTEVNGVAVNHVSGDLNVKSLVSELKKVAGTKDTTSGDPVEVPGLSGLTDIEDTISDAQFDLYASKDIGYLQQADLTLSLASQSSMPATRIRFRLSGIQPDQGN